MSLLCQVYRSSRREETYLYVDKSRGLEDVPQSLLETFGEPREVMVLLLDPARRLARADPQEVMRSIRERGYFLQLPPAPAVPHRGGRDERRA